MLIQLLIIKHLASIAAVIKPVLIEAVLIYLFTSFDKMQVFGKLNQNALRFSWNPARAFGP